MRISKLFSAALLGALATQSHATAVLDVTAGERAGFAEIYQLNIPNTANYNGATPAYSLNNSGVSYAQGISRIAYYLELGNANGRTWVWVSMDAFTQNLSQIGVPVANSTVFQRTLSNLHVQSNSGNVTTGTIATGNIEFWNNCYSQNTGLGGIGGNAGTFDYNDTVDSNKQCYGSMQISNYSAGQTIFAYNRWDENSSANSDLGIGNQASGNPDWTFASSANLYTLKSLEVWVLPSGAGANAAPEPAMASLLALGLLAMRRRSHGIHL